LAVGAGLETVTTRALRKFFERLGEQVSGSAQLYLVGGSALCLLGSPRETLDIDYFIENAPPATEEIIKTLSAELKLDLESVPIGEFIPLPPDAETRRRLVGRFGQVEVYIFDLYSIALSKIARGFESDLEDVEFLLREELIFWDLLKTYFVNVLPEAYKADINPHEFKTYFETLEKKLKH
jgi:hypothetical protein